MFTFRSCLSLSGRLALPVLLGFMFVPRSASAQAFQGIEGIVDGALFIVDLLILLAAAIAVLVFFWGIAKFIFKTGSEDNVDDGKRLMVWGIIALFVLFSIGGILYFIRAELGIGGGGVFELLDRPGPGSGGSGGGGGGGGGNPFDAVGDGTEGAACNTTADCDGDLVCVGIPGFCGE